MAFDILLPKIGFSMNEETLAEWLVADGGQVVEGVPLMISKATNRRRKSRARQRAHLRSSRRWAKPVMY
jgi:hypothetical protein